MKALFTKRAVQDEDLIKLINVVVSKDMERRSKLGSLARQKSSTVNEVDVSRVEGVAQPEETSLKVKVAEKDRSRKIRSCLHHKLFAVLKLDSVKRNQANAGRISEASPEYQNQQWISDQ